MQSHLKALKSVSSGTSVAVFTEQLMFTVITCMRNLTWKLTQPPQSQTIDRSHSRLNVQEGISLTPANALGIFLVCLPFS